MRGLLILLAIFPLIWSSPSSDEDNFIFGPAVASYPKCTDCLVTKRGYSGSIPYQPDTAEPQPQKGPCELGHYRCNGQGFLQCQHNIWIQRACGPGTVCHQVGPTEGYCGWPSEVECF
ncbi:Chitinase 2 [Basidiobolus ranarum]|uniref:Chitinase 2 n=1 Tax=Basidiobolus ranarum TaxID=34480 RepID=A0ABR2VRM6_9FUNG